MSKMIITIHPNERMSGGGRYYRAYKSNGRAIAEHYCSDDRWARHDLGERRKELYDNLFPEGYVVNFSDKIKRVKDRNDRTKVIEWVLSDQAKKVPRAMISEYLLNEGAFVEAGDL